LVVARQKLTVLGEIETLRATVQELRVRAEAAERAYNVVVTDAFAVVYGGKTVDTEAPGAYVKLEPTDRWLALKSMIGWPVYQFFKKYVGEPTVPNNAAKQTTSLPWDTAKSAKERDARFRCIGSCALCDQHP